MKITTGLPAHDLNAVGPAAKAIEERGFGRLHPREPSGRFFTVSGSGNSN